VTRVLQQLAAVQALGHDAADLAQLACAAAIAPAR